MTVKSTFYPRVFALGVAAFLSYALIRIFTPFIGSIAWAAFLAFLLFPLNLRLRRRLRGNPSLAAGLLTLLTPLVLVLPLSALSIEFVSQISVLIKKSEAWIQHLDIKSIADLQHFPLIARANLWLSANASISADQIHTWLSSGSRELLQQAAGLSGSFFLGALSSMLGFTLMLFFLFFFLCDGETMVSRARKLIPLGDALKERLFSRLSGVTRAIVFGTSMTALLQGVVLGIGFAITGLPSPVVFGVIGALLAMLPVGGTALLWVPAVIWLFFDGHWGFALFMLTWGIMLAGVDNVLRPMLISGRAPISPLAVFIGVLGGLPAFGAIGIIAGPIVISLTLALVEFAEEHRAPH